LKAFRLSQNKSLIQPLPYYIYYLKPLHTLPSRSHQIFTPITKPR